MPVVLANEFLSVFPEFADSGFSIDRIDFWLDTVETIHCPSSVWTDPLRRQKAIMLKTAHYLETQRQQMAQTASMGAAISTGQTPGSNSVSDELDQTSYGRQFKQLRKTLPITGFAF